MPPMLHGDARRRCWVAAAAQGAGGRDAAAATGMLEMPVGARAARAFSAQWKVDVRC